ncbi:hypothetical protein GA0115251_104511 [Streptomyces sp. TverLS-915]|nr:hypothetical protein GA0115251_104511 [Streptomyces sp. TverLS-915]
MSLFLRVRGGSVVSGDGGGFGGTLRKGRYGRYSATPQVSAPRL